MFELWARKRTTEGVGSSFELIFPFEDYNYRFTAVDLLDRNVYQEALIVNEEQRCIMHVEFEKPLQRRRVNNKC